MKLRGKLPGLSYTPNLRIVVYLTMLTRGNISFERSENKMPQRVKQYKVDIVRYITVVEEHSIRMKYDRKDIWTK